MAAPQGGAPHMNSFAIYFAIVRLPLPDSPVSRIAWGRRFSTAVEVRSSVSGAFP